jgi:ankyrin repeat protein
MSPHGHYPYPLDDKQKPIDTCEWRDASRISYHAPNPHEKNAPDNDLLKAIRNFETGGMAAVDAALAAGADINAKDKMGYTPLHLALKCENSALSRKFADIEGVDLNSKTNKGFTPMLVAAWKGDLGMVQSLITKGADIKATDTMGRNVWGVAHDWHKEEILELLKRNDFHYQNGDHLAFPPHPKWRPENRNSGKVWPS